MLCGGEPLVVPHFLALAENARRAPASGSRSRPTASASTRPWRERLARLPIRSVQISLDGDTEATYARQRVGALAGGGARRLPRGARRRACRWRSRSRRPASTCTRPGGHRAGALARRLPLQHRPADAHRHRRAAVGPARAERGRVRASSAACSNARARRLEGEMELCYEPFEIGDGLRASLDSPPATLLVLPNGWVKVAAALPQICADLRHDRLDDAWDAYRAAWRSDKVVAAARRVDRRRGACSQTRMAGRRCRPAGSRSSRRIHERSEADDRAREGHAATQDRRRRRRSTSRSGKRPSSRTSPSRSWPSRTSASPESRSRIAMQGRSVDDYDAPLFLAWQLTNRCSARCLACCEESGPDKAWRDELSRDEALDLADAHRRLRHPLRRLRRRRAARRRRTAGISSSGSPAARRRPQARDRRQPHRRRPPPTGIAALARRLRADLGRRRHRRDARARAPRIELRRARSRAIERLVGARAARRSSCSSPRASTCTRSSPPSISRPRSAAARSSPVR